MSIIEKLTDIDTTEKESDQLLKVLISKKLNDDFKRSFEEKLNARSANSTNIVKTLPLNKRKWFLMVSSIAAAMLLLVMMNSSIFNAPSADLMAMHLLESSAIAHPGSSRSTAVVSQPRSAAILYFNKGQFDMALQSFQEIEEKTYEDEFYMGLSYLKTGAHDAAISQLNKSINNSLYVQESRYNLILLYIISGKEDQALRLIDDLKSGDYKFAEIMNLKKKMIH